MSKTISKYKPKREQIKVEENNLSTEFKIGDIGIKLSFTQSIKSKGTYKNKKSYGFDLSNPNKENLCFLKRKK